MTLIRRASDADIARACSYITDNNVIAEYFNVDLPRVARLRQKHSQRETHHVEREHRRPPMHASAEEKRMRADAVQGSRDLLRALAKYIIKRETMQKAIAQDVVT